MFHIFITVTCWSTQLNEVVDTITYDGPTGVVNPSISPIPSHGGTDRYKITQIFTDLEIMWDIADTLLTELHQNINIHHA